MLLKTIFRTCMTTAIRLIPAPRISTARLATQPAAGDTERTSSATGRTTPARRFRWALPVPRCPSRAITRPTPARRCLWTPRSRSRTRTRGRKPRRMAPDARPLESHHPDEPPMRRGWPGINLKSTGALPKSTLSLWGAPVSLQTEAVRPEVQSLARRSTFHSVTEARKPGADRRHHENDLCGNYTVRV